MISGEVFEEFNSFGVRENGQRKRCIVGAGLKMYLSYRETIGWLESIKDRAAGFGDVGVYALPSFPALGEAQNILAGTRVLYGAQDTFWEDRGPYTGEVSPLILRELGCTFVEVGHSERRTMFCETDEWVQRKTKAVLSQGLIPLICIGEPTKQSTDLAIELIYQQLHEALGGSSINTKVAHSGAVVIAYEPGWAIGAEKSAPVEHIEPIIVAINEELRNLWNGSSAVLYGGSVTKSHVEELMQTGIDGLFIGRASLNIDHFCEIIMSVASCAN